MRKPSAGSRDNAAALEALPLRQRKFAKTKLAILRALLRHLDERPLESISTKELAQEVEISDGTFFNYFPKKTDLLVYFIQLWSLEMGWHAGRAAESGTAKEAIVGIFVRTAAQMEGHPTVMREIIQHMARAEGVAPTPLTLAERYAAFPNLVGIEDVPELGFDAIVLPLLIKAIARRELPKLDVELAMLGLASLFFGVPLLAASKGRASIAQLYEAEIEIWWRGLAATPAHARGRR